MLPLKLRLDLRAYPDFFLKAKGVRGAMFTLLYAPLPDSTDQKFLGSTRFAVSISKRLARGVERVKIKRQVRHMLIDLFQHSPALFQSPHAVVVIPKSPIPLKKFAAAQGELATLLAKLP